MKDEVGHTIILHKKRNKYTQVPNKIFDDIQLSWKAKGILAYLIGRPSNWLLRISDISRHSSGDKEASVRSGLQELRNAGYVRLKALRSKGKISTWTWHISDRPIFKQSPDCGFQDLENQEVEKQEVENHHISKTDRLSRLIDRKTDEYKKVLPSNPSDIEGHRFFNSNRESVMIITDKESEEGDGGDDCE